MEFIPYGRQLIEEDDIAAVAEVLRSPFITTGPVAGEFETALCALTGANYAIVLSSGTAALHVAALAMDIKPGDEVIVPALTFAASANCILYAGGVPVFADIDKDTMLLDIKDVEQKITPKTKGIVPVHYAGELCDMDALQDLAEKHGLFLIQDSAHSLGSTCSGKGQGEYSGIQEWSFHPVKTITTGEGGAVTTNDEELYKKMLRFRSHGITRDLAQHVHKKDEPWYYEMLDLGFNYRITDFQCALGLSQLKKLPRFAKRRREIVNAYDEAFANLPIQLQTSPEHSDAVRHLYTIRADDSSRRKTMFDKLMERNVGCQVHYQPVYYLPYYEQLGYKKGLCPVAEDAYSRLISIPLHPSMSDEQVEYVIQQVKEVVWLATEGGLE